MYVSIFSRIIKSFLDQGNGGCGDRTVSSSYLYYRPLAYYMYRIIQCWFDKCVSSRWDKNETTEQNKLFNFSTVDTSGQIILCTCPVHCDMLSNMPGLYSSGPSDNVPSPILTTPKCLQTCQMSPGVTKSCLNESHSMVLHARRYDYQIP